MKTILLSAALVTAVGLSPAAAWEFSPVPICTLASQASPVDVKVTYDASLPEYAIHLVRADGWPMAPVFSISFEGGAGLTISTDRHSVDGTTLTVRDRGFGNVLRGLSQNQVAVAILGDVRETIDLSGASPAVAAFEACPGDLSV